MSIDIMPASVVAEELGERLKQARLNADMTQTDLANRAGLSRKVVLNAEKGKVQLEAFVAIMLALNLSAQLDNFLPKQSVSPVQLVKLQAKQRKRASRKSTVLKPPQPDAPATW
jgi:putative transcriptional regulator